jgi:hypothetical protein
MNTSARQLIRADCLRGALFGVYFDPNQCAGLSSTIIIDRLQKEWAAADYLLAIVPLCAYHRGDLHRSDMIGCSCLPEDGVGDESRREKISSLKRVILDEFRKKLTTFPEFVRLRTPQDEINGQMKNFLLDQATFGGDAIYH